MSGDECEADRERLGLWMTGQVGDRQQPAEAPAGSETGEGG
jgi:hypothetical protein